MNYLRYKMLHSYRKKGVLPDGYTQLEYIEGTGTQYIDTEYIPTEKTRLDFDFQPTAVGAHRYVGTPIVSDKSFSVGMDGIDFCIRFYSDEPFRIKADTTRHFLTMGKNGFFWDGIRKTNFFYNNFVSDSTLSFFQYGAEPSIRGLMKLYSAKVYTNEVIKLNLIPCKNQNNQVGLYDTVTRTFFGNAGTGEFIAGPVVTQ